MATTTTNEQLTQIIQPVVEGMGFEFWGIEFRHAGRHSTLAVYIDMEDGVSVDDCGDVSRQLSSVLDVEDVITYAYDLEVSSPGMDRILFNLDQIRRYVGSPVSVELNLPQDGKRRFKGELASVEDTVLTFALEDGSKVETLFTNVKRARLVPVFDKKEGKR